MRVLLIYSRRDSAFVRRIRVSLKSAGHEIITGEKLFHSGVRWVSSINEFLGDVDASILVISSSSIKDEQVSNIFSITSLNSFENNHQLIPVLIENVPVPNYIESRLYVNLTESFPSGMSKLLFALERSAQREKQEVEHQNERPLSNSQQIATLSSALRAGRLTLVCGAGISVSAGVPVWNDLLFQLLKSTLSRLSTSLSNIDPEEARVLQSKYSTLVMGKFLKTVLGQDFLEQMRLALYGQNPTTCEIINSIVRLARPVRDGQALNSIITFNFDSLLEEQLERAEISHHPVFSEGVRTQPHELPVYHVHGYLPRKGRISQNMQIVFSEDAYHSQFIEPFSWSNLVQLNKLSECTCLFVGLSLSDPNLRRLLDVANRKNSDGKKNHFLIKKTPTDSKTTSPSDNIVRLLEERDANQLGLNMIWVEQFSEIPKLLDSVSK